MVATTPDTAASQAVRQKARRQRDDELLVWPDLVFIEFIAAMVFTLAIVLLSIAINAPLLDRANPAVTPNPSKAPWYFLGLQEMLVYFDPWLAGVVLPLIVVQGLMAIPYIDFNKKGNGYYTFNDRKFSVIVFLFGFLVLQFQRAIPHFHRIHPP